MITRVRVGRPWEVRVGRGGAKTRRKTRRFLRMALGRDCDVGALRRGVARKMHAEGAETMRAGGAVLDAEARGERIGFWDLASPLYWLAENAEAIRDRRVGSSPTPEGGETWRMKREKGLPAVGRQRVPTTT